MMSKQQVWNAELLAPRSQRGLARWKVLLLVTVLALAAVALALQMAGENDLANDLAALPRARVERGDLIVSILQSGELESKNNTQIKNDMQRNSKIINIIEDGQRVEKGDLLVELESDELRDRLLNEQAAVSRAEADLLHAQKGLEISELQYNTDRTNAELKVELADLELKKYEEAEYPKRLREAKQAIDLADEELLRAEDKLRWSTELTSRGYTSRQELEANRLAVKRKEIELENKKTELSILTDYTHKKELREKHNSLNQARDSLARLLKTYESQRARDEANLEAKEVALTTARNQLKKIEDQLANSKIYAERAGRYFYPVPNRRNSNRDIEKGAAVYPQQTLLEFPDLTEWQVKVGVPESIIDKIDLGQRAVVSIDALPDAVIEAEVSRVGIVPDRTRWFDSNNKTYSVSLDVPGTVTLQLKPGMSAMVEIIANTLENVLYVPVQAVAAHDGKHYVYKANGKIEPVEVEVGENSEAFIEVLSGLSEGDEILTYAPVSMDTQAGVRERPLEKQQQQEKEAEADASGPAS